MNHSLTQRISISINTFEHLLVSTLTITLLSLHPASICSQMVQKRNLFFIKPIFHPTVRTLIESDVTITKSIEDANDSLVLQEIPTSQFHISKEATIKDNDVSSLQTTKLLQGSRIKVICNEKVCLRHIYW